MSFRQSLYARLPGLLRRPWDRIEASPLGARLARGAFWSLVGAVISRGLSLAASILVARMLGKEGFGELGMIQSTVGMFGTFAGFGLGLTATKHVAEFREKDPAKAGRILALSGVVAWVTGGVATVALFVAAPWLAERTIAAPHLADELRIGSLLVLLGAVNGAQTGALAGFEAFKRIAVVNLWAGLANFPCLVVGCHLYGLPGAVWGLVAALGVNCVMNRWALTRVSRTYEINLWDRGWRTELQVLWKFSLPTAISSVMISPVYWVIQAWLVNGWGFEAQAEYAVGAQWRTLTNFLPCFLLGAYLPVFSSLGSVQAEFRLQCMHRVIAMCLGLVLIFVLPIWVLAPFFLPYYGENFAHGLWVLRVLLLASFADAVNEVLVQSMLGSGEAWWRLVSNGLWALLTLGLGFYLISSRGGMGLALTLTLCQGFHLLLQYPLARLALRRSALGKEALCISC